MALDGVRVIGVLRANDAGLAYEAACAAFRGGISTLEVTLTTPGAVDLIATLKRELPNALIGAGSIVSTTEADAALTAGAEFFVSPHSDASLMRWFAERRLTYVPGCMTPTELVAARAAGCAFQKLFPASVHGPSGVRGILSPLPFLNLIVTGGVDDATAKAFLEAGAKAICVGTSVFSKARLAARNWLGIEHAAADIVELVKGTAG